jgi:hypothetical protein
MLLQTNAAKTDYVHTFKFSNWGKRCEDLPEEIYENRNAFMAQYKPAYVSGLMDQHRFELSKLLLFNKASWVERYRTKTQHILLVSIPIDTPEYTLESFTENKWIRVLPVVDENHITYMKIIDKTSTTRNKARLNKTVKLFHEVNSE